MASTDTGADLPVLVVCPIAVDTYTELFVAMNLITVNFLPGGFTRMPTKEEANAAADAADGPVKAVLSYYATRLVGLYTSNALTERGPQHCEPENVAYIVLRGKSPDECVSLTPDAALPWLAQKKIDRDQLYTLSSGFNEALYLAVVAHELGHVAIIGNEGGSAMDEEIEADRFAREILRGDPSTFYMAGEALESMNILWIVISQLKLKTRYELPSHEEKRATAYVLEWRCKPRTDIKDPLIARLIEDMRSLKMTAMPPGFCEKLSK
jgi:hypothetical protein